MSEQKRTNLLPTGYSIRLASSEDILVLREIEVAAASRFRGMGLIDHMLDSAMDQTRLSELISEQRVWVACSDGIVVGFAATSVLGEDEDFLLEELDVLPDHGGKGLGRSLIDAVVQAARKQGYSRVVLSTFSRVPWNAPFYSKVGFSIVGAQDFTAEMHRLQSKERSVGLPMDQRVIMQKSC